VASLAAAEPIAVNTSTASIPDVTNTNPSSSVPDDTSPVPEKPKARSWNQATLGGGISGITSSEALPSHEKETPQLVEGQAREEVTVEEFLKVWHLLADQFKASNKINLFTLMTSHAPRLMGGNTIEVMIENSIQQEWLQTSSIDILNDLRPQLRNYELQIVGVQVEGNVQRRPYTSSEKYHFMVEKNPLLEELKNSFNLGLDS